MQGKFLLCSLIYLLFNFTTVEIHVCNELTSRS